MDNYLELTQYLRPNGKPKKVYFNFKDDLETFNKAQEILKNGFLFTCEHLENGSVVLYISDPEIQEDPGIAICQNGPQVPISLKLLIQNFNISAALKMRENVKKGGSNGRL